MAQYQKKVTDVFGVQNKKGLEWSIISFGLNILEQYLTNTKSTTKMEINSTTIFQTLNLLRHYNTKENIQGVNYELMDGINLAECVENLNTLTITIKAKKDGSTQDAKSVMLKLQLKIKEKENKSDHPTLKPIALNYQITKLFKTPNPQTVLVPFSGAGSELIGLFKAGFENIKGCELNPEYVEIAKTRVKHHCEDLFNQNVLK
jgi:DNA modification methylase